MARPFGNTFENIMPLLKEYNTGGFNWGLAAGKTQAQFPWDSWQINYGHEPQLWFHDIFLPNDKPYDEKEITFIKEMTKKEIETGYKKVA